nr:hypothetical protein [Tanacetum cinerariifolium]
ADKRRTSLSNVVPVQMKELVLDQGFWVYHLMTQRKNFHGTLLMMKIDDGNDDDNDETVKAGSKRDEDDNDNNDEEELAKNDDEDTESGESDEEEIRQEEEESFDLIPRTIEGSEDEGSDEEDQELRHSDEARIQEEEEADELYREAPIPPPTIPSIILENLPTFNSAFRFEERLRSLETSFSEYRQINQFADAVSAIPGIVHQYMDQQMKEARRRGDDDQEGPSAGSNWGSKRQKERGEQASASTPSEKATKGAADLQQGLNLDKCLP